MAGAVGKAGNGAGQVVHRVFSDGRGHAGSAERYGHIAHGHAEAQRGHGIVSAAGADDAAAFNVLAGNGGVGLDGGCLTRAQHGGQHNGVGVGLGGFLALGRGQHHGDEIAAVLVMRGIVVNGAGSVGTVGEQGFEMSVLALGHRAIAGDTPAQPIVRQTDGGNLLGVLRLVLGHPRHLGQRVGGDGGGSDGLDPALLAAGGHVVRFVALGRSCTELVDQGGGLRGGTGVIPEHRIANHVALLVENDHAMLLAANREGRDIVKPAGLLGGLGEGLPPEFRVDRGAIRVLGLPEPNLFAGGGVRDADLR